MNSIWTQKSWKQPLGLTLLALGALIVPSSASAQSVVGGLANFDAANFEGKNANGFE